MPKAKRVPVGQLPDDPAEKIELEYLTPMLLIPFLFFVQLGRIPKSTKPWREEARSKGWLVEYRREDGKIVIFISQTWWDREYLDPDRDPNDEYDVGAPDNQEDYPDQQREVEVFEVFVKGEWVDKKETRTYERPKDLKWRIIVAGVERLIAEKGLEASDVMLWMDWPCIYQARPRPGRAAAPARAPTPARRAAAGRQGGEAQGRQEPDQVRPASSAQHAPSTTSTQHHVDRYAALSDFMLVPLEEEKLEGAATNYPNEIPGYGPRGWCRVEWSPPRLEPWSFRPPSTDQRSGPCRDRFIYALASEMRSREVELYAILRDGKLHQYPQVRVLDEKVMPSGGALSNEADRPLVRALEDKMIEVYGKVIVEVMCKPGGVVNLSLKMLRPMHMEALGEAVARYGVKQLYLISNQLGAEGAKQLAAWLRGNETLEVLQ